MHHGSVAKGWCPSRALGDGLLRWRIAGMGTEALRLRWIVCGAETRPVTGQLVACPAGRLVTGASCLECRFLVTSSVERTGAGWCELPEPSSGQLGVVAAHARSLAPVRMARFSPPSTELQPSLPVVVPIPQPPGTPPVAELVAVGLA